MRSGSVALFLGLVLAAILALPASAEGPVDVRIVEANDEHFPTITVLLEVEEDERPVASLAASDLVVSEGNVPAEVVSVERATDLALPLNLVLTLDISGSMIGERLEFAKTAARTMIANLQPSDTAAVLSFASTARIEQPLGTVPATLLGSIDALVAAGDTALFDAVSLSSEVAGAAAGRRAVVLLSDGEDFGGVSTATRETSIAAAGESGAIFYVIGLEGGELDREFLEELAAATGGAYFAVSTPQELPAAYRVIEERLRSQFVVTIASAAPGPDTARSVDVEVSLPSGKGSASHSYTSRRPRVTPEAAATVVPPTMVPTAPAPADQGSTSASESSPLAVIGVTALAVLLLAVAIGFLLFRRRRASEGTPAPADRQQVAIQRPSPAPAGAPPVARLAGAQGAGNYDLRAEPLAVGSDPGCQVLLPAAPGIAGLHARLWWRDGRAMLHHVDPATQTLVNGVAADWVSLSPGDRVQFGPHEFLFEPLPAAQVTPPGALVSS
ncbi:MAG: VWA domain-containing protein [Dehalococcoidia bacterium]|nr:VWA domain-containing protein [Dehalococcoidia bacterium]